MSYAFERSEDGLVTIRTIIVEPDLPSALWAVKECIGRGDCPGRGEGEMPSPIPGFARARRAKSDFRNGADDFELDSALKTELEFELSQSRRWFTPTAFLRFESVERKGTESVLIGGKLSIRSKRLCQLLRNCDECALFMCTLGRAVEDPVRSAIAVRDYHRAAVLEAIATTGLLDLSRRIQRRIELIARKEGLKVTHCQWPGFCDWPGEGALDVVARLGGGANGPVSWSADKGYSPTWSFSGLVGLGRGVSRISNNPCRSCDKRRDCPQRIW